ncbi:MAG: non-hydrolyzing UDP-N-acetylglucosamine 2-epimerase, partial [Chitinophagaceae bacterium]
AGARPNFMKIAPIIKAIKLARESGRNIRYRLVHTGQHYDKKMSDDFFEQLEIPEPDANLGAGSGSQAEQTAAIMVSFEKELVRNKPEVVLVVGDVTSTLACAIVSKKLCVPVVHVEAGIRSGDMAMPEEINRIVTDSITDHFFTTSETANRNLITSGITRDRIHFVGNTIIDTLLQNLQRTKQPAFWTSNGLKKNIYYLLTLHRPANVDVPSKLQDLLQAILNGTEDAFVVFPVHPRTKQQLEVLQFSHPRLLQIEPMGYLEFIYMIRHAKGIITDSGGITEEATILNVPCMTLRNSTERPETVTLGSNELVGTDPSNLLPFLRRLQFGQWKKASVPPLWDGHTAERIVTKLLEIYCPLPKSSPVMA